MGEEDGIIFPPGEDRERWKFSKAIGRLTKVAERRAETAAAAIAVGWTGPPEGRERAIVRAMWEEAERMVFAMGIAATVIARSEDRSPEHFEAEARRQLEQAVIPPHRESE